MTRTLLAIALIVGSFSSAWAVRLIDQPESSFELTLADVTLPENAGGEVAFKSCALCRTSTFPVDRTTKYFIDGAQVAFPDFLLGVAEISDTRNGRQSTFVGLFVDNESKRVQRIVLQRVKK